MVEQREKEEIKELGRSTGRDPIVLAAGASVLLAWYQYYIRGNREHGLFIGLWPPTMLAFSNAIRINDISQELEGRTANLYERFMNR